MTTQPSDVEIAQAHNLQPIAEIAAKAGIPEDAVIPFGSTKAKVDITKVDYAKDKRGKLVLVTGVSPTPAGEGKSTVLIGLTDALDQIGKKAIVALREPSQGPVMGIKGGAAGGGYSQVVPMEDINLHFTGDFHAIAAATNTLAAIIDNHIHQGNALGIDHLARSVRPLTIRYFLTAAHYRSMIEYHDGSLAEAQAAVERIEGFLDRALPDTDTLEPTGDEELPEQFAAALDDDLGISGALAVVHDHVRRGNTQLDDGEREAAAATARTVVAMTDVLGVNPLSPAWHRSGGGQEQALESALDVLVRRLVDDRAAARAARDFATADAIRDTLAGAGILVEDTPSGARWSLAKDGAA